MRYLFVFIIIGACSCQNKPVSFDGAEWVDLTHSFDSTTLYWPNNLKGFEHPVDFEGMSPAGFYYSSFALSTPEHGGTHLDAPKHFAENRLAADEIPLSSLTGMAIVIDISAKALANRDYLLSIEDVQNWEKVNGQIDPNAIILIKTGYSKFYPDRLTYFGTDKKGAEAIPDLHFPGIDPNAVTWLIKNRNIKAMGLDTPSLDRGQSKNFEAHQVLLGENKPGFENLTNLDLLPAKGIYIVALPMKIAKGSGGPLRIIATVQK
jgi:kynurenine formamidase